MPPDYVRQLEDACLVLWTDMPTEEFIQLRRRAPQLTDFLAHLSHSISHEETMMRRNVWTQERL